MKMGLLRLPTEELTEAHRGASNNFEKQFGIEQSNEKLKGMDR